MTPSFTQNVQLPRMPVCNLELSRRLSDGRQDLSEWVMATDLSELSGAPDEVLEHSYGSELCLFIREESQTSDREQNEIYGEFLRTGLCIWDKERLYDLKLGPSPDPTLQGPTRSELYYSWCSILRDVCKHNPPAM